LDRITQNIYLLIRAMKIIRKKGVQTVFTLFILLSLLIRPNVYAIANPASEFCERNGYTLEIRDTDSGQLGYCIFLDTTECEEWTFYDGSCGVEWRIGNVIDIKGHIFEQYIKHLLDEGIVSGYSDKTFRPEENVTRGQMAKFVVNAFQLTIDISGEGFPDVEEENAFYDYIMTLKNQEIISGYSDGTFRSDELLTRGAATKFIVLAMNKGFSKDTTYQQSTFWDVTPNQTFSNYIAFLNAFKSGADKVINGYSDGSFKPDEIMTRGQMAKVVDLGRHAEKAPSLLEQCEQNTGTWLENSQQCNGINQDTCELLGGINDFCGSPCGRIYADSCIQVCVNACYFD